MSDLVSPSSELGLSELLDRVLNKGVVITGDLTISIAGVDLIYVGLKVLASSVETANQLRCAPGTGASRAIVAGGGAKLPGETRCSISTG
jgi:gas vesicle structural protein